MDHELIDNILSSISETGALIVETADIDIISRAQADLKEDGVPVMPDDYIYFLKNIANGVSWNGFEFFGTYQVTVKSSGYVLRNIVYMNALYRQRKMGMGNLLLVGRFDDDIYVYDSASGQYQALDSLTLIEIDTYESFEDLFTSNILPFIDDSYEEPEDDGNADS